MASAIDKLVEDHETLLSFLSDRGETSFYAMVADEFRRVLVLSAASWFEHKISEALLSFCRTKSSEDPTIFSLVRQKAIERQYFTYFDWKNKSAGPFFSLLGDPIGSGMKAETTASDQLRKARTAFLDLGHLRNTLVHENFASFSVELTAREIYEKYKDATVFVDYVCDKLS